MHSNIDGLSKAHNWTFIKLLLINITENICWHNVSESIICVAMKYIYRVQSAPRIEKYSVSWLSVCLCTA